ncbi:MAG: cytochrome P450 [Halioglobus sp.]|jgi:cytochrome P450
MKNVSRVERYTHAFDAMCDRNLVQSMYSECSVLMDSVLLVLHGDEHTLRRSNELKLFRKDFVRYYLKEVYPRTLELTLEPFLLHGRMELFDFSHRVNINLSADFAGVDRPGNRAEDTQRLMLLVRKFSEGATLFHSTRDKAEVCAEVEQALEQFDQEFFQPSKARREHALQQFERGELSEDQLPRDILTVLLQNRDALSMDDALMRREIGFFLQAGFHSTGNSTVHAFHEIYNWLQEHPEEKPRILEDRLFMQRCVHESMRLHPASPVAWRTAVCPMSLANGVDVEDQGAVVIDLQTANIDTDIFGEDAALYNPHRAIAGRYPPYGLTFGIGLHTCFGRDLAGGAVANANTDPETHHYGIVTNLIQSLFDAGARPDPANPPSMDSNTERKNWASYPVLLTNT